MQVFLYFPSQSKSVRYLEVNLAQNIHLVLKKMSAITNVRYKSVRYIEVFLWELDRDSAGSLKRCPLYNMSAIDRFDCIYLFSSILIRRYVSGMSNKLPSPLQTTLNVSSVSFSGDVDWNISETHSAKCIFTWSFFGHSIRSDRCRFLGNFSGISRNFWQNEQLSITKERFQFFTNMF